MAKIHEQTAYIEIPKRNLKRRYSKAVIEIDNDGKGYIHLEKRESVYVLTKDELEKVFDAGRNFEYGEHFGTIPNKNPNFQDYINSLK